MFNLKAEIMFFLTGRECVPMAEVYAAFPAIHQRKVLAAIHSLCIDGVADVLYTGEDITEVELVRNYAGVRH